MIVNKDAISFNYYKVNTYPLGTGPKPPIQFTHVVEPTRNTGDSE